MATGWSGVAPWSGPQGTGKTTPLGELEARLAGRFRSIRRIRATVRVRPSGAEVAAVLSGEGPDDLVSVDGAEQFGRWRWCWICRLVPGALTVTCHRPGLLPTLHEHRDNAVLLADLIRELAGPDQAGDTE